jgi:hypothetical protein
MGLILADVGARVLLNIIFNNSWPGSSKDLTLQLFVNDVTPTDTDTSSTYTEAVGGGYSSKTLVNGSWTVNPAHDPADAMYAQQQFTFTGQLTNNPTIYGYMIKDSVGTLIWAERFPVAFTPYNNDDKIFVTPKMQLSKGTPT